MEDRISGKHEETFGDDGNLSNFQCGDGFTDVYICQHSSSYTFRTVYGQLYLTEL